MTCASCVRRVEKALKTVPGVADVSVNLATHEAVVSGDGLTDGTLIEAVGSRGYGLEAPEAPEGKEASEAGWRVVVAFVLTAPLMVGMIPGLHVHVPWMFQAVLAAGAAFGAGWPFLARAAKQARKFESSMDTLIALGALSSFGFGLYEGATGSAHPPFETAAALVSFLLLGKYLEAKARHRATDALGELLKLAPATATRLRDDGGEEDIAVAMLSSGDRVRVKPGMAVPVDGVVVAGRAEVEESLLTGEPLPVPKAPGDRVIAGAIAHGGFLDVRVEATGRETWLAKLGRQVAEAQGSRAPAQALADKVSAIFVPAILVLSALTLVAWWWYAGALALAWRPAVTVLVIACPCALGLATPVAMAAALGTAARMGVLVRDAAAMDRLARVTDLAFDKTGTLTEGKPSVTNVTGETTLRLAAALEAGSEHPIAKGIVAAAKGLAIPSVQAFQSFPGGGVQGDVEGKTLRLGNMVFLNFGQPLPTVDGSGTTVGLVEGDRLIGTITLSDACKADAAALVATLKGEGIRLHLLSGDGSGAVAALANVLGIDDAEGGCSPGRKLDRIALLQAAGAVVAFVGDGVNDAPALAKADVGIALPGLEAAKASAPLNLLRADLSPIATAMRLSRRTRTVIRQNLAWAFGYNLILIPLAATNQLDRFGGPMLAGAAMGLSSLTVVLNALRLRR